MTIQSRLTGKKSRKPMFHKVILAFLGISVIIALSLLYRYYTFIYKPNIWTAGDKEVSVLIPTGSTFEEVKTILYSRGLINNHKSFEWVARKKLYTGQVKPGHYVIRRGMNNNELVNMLRAGLQTPVRVVFNNIRTTEQLAGKIALQIEADSTSLIKCWQDRDFLRTLGFTPFTVSTMFLPNTYEMWWTSDAYEFTTRMHKEYNQFWKGQRSDKAEAIPLSIQDVVILASIVEKETQKNDEKTLIAGVYLNRLRKGWPLQADPTLVFASGDFELKRVLNKHKNIDSPYNTYKNTGLPPGPICIPSIASIDAVLDYRRHDYMFFCAKDDLSGYHAFSRTLAEHNRHARAYQKALNQRGLYE